jgi:hypothetical protein
MSTWSVVVPTVRPNSFITFLDAWNDLFHRHDVYLIVVQDNGKHFEEVREGFHYSGIEGELHHHHTIEMEFIPHKSDMIRSWGIYRAWKHPSDYVLSLDDDVIPDGDPFERYEYEFERARPFSPYLSVGAMTSAKVEMRGFPYEQRTNGKVMVQYGGWNGVLDYDAHTQMKGVNEDELFWPYVMPVPKGAAATTCIMNAAWRREFSREMWQFPLYHQRYNRFGDIWSGLVQKKVLDATDGVMLINGRASVRHERASNPKVNMRREKPGIPVNEKIWDHLEEGNFREVTASVYWFFREHDPEYADYFMKARREWMELFDA